MATRIMVDDMLDSFCNLFGKIKTPGLVDAWMKALGRFRDAEIISAGHKAMEECQKMPTPQDVIQRMTVNQTVEESDFRITSAKCSRCGRFGMAISEPQGVPYLCRECYSGMTNEQIAAKFRELGGNLGSMA